MAAILFSIPVLGLGLLLQTSIVSRIQLLSGNADLILLILAAWALQERVRYAWAWGILASVVVGLFSGVPWYLYLISYMTVVGLARLLTRRVWQAPLLAMFAVTLAGTLVLLMLTYIQRTLFQTTLDFREVLGQIILPSLLLNLLLALPVHAMMRDIARRLYPQEAGL
jgi:hypothetical protein